MYIPLNQFNISHLTAVFSIVLFTLPVLFSSNGFALDKDLGAFYKFFTHMYEENGNKVCNTYTQATAQSGIVRGKAVSLNITSRPYKKLKNKLSIQMGMKLKSGSKITLKTKDKSYTLFSHNTYAFPQDSQDRAIIKSLKKSNLVKVISTAINGAKMVDEYSMRGVTKAILSINRTCR